DKMNKTSLVSLANYKLWEVPDAEDDISKGTPVTIKSVRLRDNKDPRTKLQLKGDAVDITATGMKREGNYVLRLNAKGASAIRKINNMKLYRPVSEDLKKRPDYLEIRFGTNSIVKGTIPAHGTKNVMVRELGGNGPRLEVHFERKPKNYTDIQLLR